MHKMTIVLYTFATWHLMQMHSFNTGCQSNDISQVLTGALRVLIVTLEGEIAPAWAAAVAALTSHSDCVGLEQLM